MSMVQVSGVLGQLMDKWKILILSNAHTFLLPNFKKIIKLTINPYTC